MIILFDKYTDFTKKLQETMRQLERAVNIVVLEDNGFLPCGITSPYEYFTFRQNGEIPEERKVSCDSLEIPEFWEIRMQGNNCGIYEMGCEKARIYLKEPLEEQIVQRVEWHMENGWIYKIDYYNKYGFKYASEFFDTEKKVESKVYYSERNQEVLVSQPQNDVMTLLENGTVKAFFNSYAQFVEFYLEKIVTEDGTVLFVQEAKQYELLNLKCGEKNAWSSVLFADREWLERYVNEGGQNGYGFYAIPAQYPENYANGNAMILTASDQIEKLEELVQELPEVTFHVAAHTQVSNKLHRLAERENVKVYPGISAEDLNGLWNRCDFYLDINHYREIDDAVNEASRKNLLILGFENTLHHRELTVKGCIFSVQDYQKMVRVINRLQKDGELMQKVLQTQQKKRRKVWQNFLESYCLQ